MSATTDRSRWLALYVLCLGMLMIVLDVTIVNVALPSIQEDLRFSTASLTWIVSAYLFAFGGLLRLAGRVGVLIGRRRIFLSGVALFTGASLLCGLAQSAWWLVAARFIQGVGGAMTSAVILGMIVTMFPAGSETGQREQAKAIGVFAFVASAGGSVGLLAGGVLTQSINWHWIFFVNIPIGVATALAARRLVPDEPGIGLREGADVPGALLITSALMLGVYTIVGPAAKHGWGSASTLALGAGSLALAGFVVFALAPVHAAYATQVAPSMLLLGLGAGTAFPALMNLAMSGATPEDAGLASGLVNTTAQVGGALGLAVLATLSASHANALKASGHSTPSSLTSGYHLAFWVDAALVACA